MRIVPFLVAAIAATATALPARRKRAGDTVPVAEGAEVFVAAQTVTADGAMITSSRPARPSCSARTRSTPRPTR